MKSAIISRIDIRHFFGIALLLLPVIGLTQTLDHLQPNQAGIGQTITVVGTGFDVAMPPNNLVWFTNPAGGTVLGMVSNVTSTSVDVKIPEKAGLGPVYFQVGGGTPSNSVTFTPSAPMITYTVPAVGISKGQIIKVHGLNFNPTGENQVTLFNQIIVDSEVTFRQPQGDLSDELDVKVPSNLVAPQQGVLRIDLPNGTWVESQTLILRDPPTIVNNSPQTSVVYNTNLAVTVAMTTPGSVNPVGALWYRSISSGIDGPFNSVAMSYSGSTFTGSIPKAGIGELGVEYKIKVIDDLGLVNTDTTTLYTVAVHYQDGMEITSYPSTAAGHEATNYRIVGIPLVLTHNTVEGVFFNELGKYDPSVYRLFTYDGIGTGFTELSGTSPMVPGKGFWFITAQSRPLNTGDGITVPVTTSGPFMMEIKPGWNLIGNPYDFNISWADIITANPQVPDLDQGNTALFRVYRGESSNVDILHATEGGFVRYTGPSQISIQIPVKKNLAIAGGRVKPNGKMMNSLDKTSWEISFDLYAGKTHDPFGGIGMRPDASEGFDKYDDYASPRFFDFLEVKFPKSYAGMTVSKDVVPTKENFVWKFEVASNVDENTTIQWDNSYFGDAREIYLLDMATFRVVDMRKETQYHFSRNISRDFKVVFGNAEFVKNELTPDRVMVSEPYPNPFSDRIAVDFALPASHQTEGVIEIFDAVGSRISSVSTGSTTGPSHWEWQAESQAPGIYFVRVSMGAEMVTRKIFKK